MPTDPAHLRTMSQSELVARARHAGVDNAAGMSAQELVAQLMMREQNAEGEGVLEILPDGFGFLRAPEFGYAPGADDVYVSPSQIRRFNLRTGDTVRGQVRAPKENERYFALIKVERINGDPADGAREKVLFDHLIPAPPTRAIPGWWTGIDPTYGSADELGFGARVFVAGARGSGRTSILGKIARNLATLPGVSLFTVFVAERPEEVPELRKAFPGEVTATTFDEADARHVQVLEIVAERVRRQVEARKDVVLLIDSVTRYARAAHATAPANGRVVGGVDVAALRSVRKILASARAIEGGGSLSIFAVIDAPDPLADELSGVENARIEVHHDTSMSVRVRPRAGMSAAAPA